MAINQGLFVASLDDLFTIQRSEYNEKNQKIITRNFDPKLLFLGVEEEPLKLCQKLLETVIDHPVFCTSRPSISVPSLMPNAMDHLPDTTRHLQIVMLGNKFNWRANEQEAVFYVTDYDTIKFEGTKTRREIGIEDFLEHQKLSRNNLFGVIYQSKEPVWLSSIHSAEIFNFKKRLATVLQIPQNRVFWVRDVKDTHEFIENVMCSIYRWRIDKECEENERIVRGEFKSTDEIKKQELYQPITMCYGDITDRNGINLTEGV